MKDIKMRILKMLEEGKISAEEAIRLLESLEKTKKKEKTNEIEEESIEQESSGLDSVFTSIGEMVTSILKSIPRMVEKGINIPHSSQRRTIDASNIYRVVVKVIGGDITVRTSDDKRVVVSNISFPGSIKKADGEILVKSMGGDIDLTVPKGIPLRLKVVGGDTKIRDLEQDASISIQGGDLTVHIKSPKRIDSKLQGGDLTVYLPKDAQLRIFTDLDDETSELIFEEDLEGRVIQERSTVYRIGDNPEGEFHIKVVDGTVVFKAE